MGTKGDKLQEIETRTKGDKLWEWGQRETNYRRCECEQRRQTIGDVYGKNGR